MQIAQGLPDSEQLRKAVKDDLVGREIIVQETQKKGYARSALLLRAENGAGRAIFDETLRRIDAQEIWNLDLVSSLHPRAPLPQTECLPCLPPRRAELL